MKKKESKTVLLPLADGRKVRIDKEKISSIGVGYGLFSKTCKTYICTRTGKQYVVSLTKDAARSLIYGENKDR